MKTVQIRNIEIGTGMPKVCVPMVGCNQATLLSEIEILKEAQMDVVEWRMDFFEEVTNMEATLEMLAFVRNELHDIPFLVTFRSKQEGGEKEVSNAYYTQLYKAIIVSGHVDMIDIELFRGDALVKDLVETAHSFGVYVVMSNHDFFTTPTHEEIVKRLRLMQEMNADIPKIAVMPTSKRDVLTLLSATCDMSENYADRPIITMSMAETGVISRLTGEVFGSALTFGAAKKASAPGQMGVNDLKTVLEILHKSL